MSTPSNRITLPGGAILRPGALLRSAGARQGLVLGAAMLVAGALDYAVSVVAGRWLAPAEFGVFVAVTALLQVLLSVATAIRMVVAFYTADLAARPGTADSVGPFLRRTARWCGRWGLLAGGAMALASPAVAAALHVPGPAPLWAASAMVLMLFVREPVLGALQGLQAFGQLGRVQVSQAVFRLLLAMALILAGWRAAGAVLAQPLAAAAAVAIALPRLGPTLSSAPGGACPPVSRSYAVLTVVGLAAFGVLTNVDALFVKVAFAPRVAGDFGTVVTLEKMSLFLPWAISFVLFPKATHRSATGRDPRPLLLMALGAALAPGVVLSALYLAAPGPIVRAVFTGAYEDPGAVLGLVSLAGTLFAGVNIWLSYALSTGRTGYVRVLLAVVVLQALALCAFARGSLTAVAITMVAAGIGANVAGALTAWSALPLPAGEPALRDAAAYSAPRRARPRAATRVLAIAGAALAAGYVLLVGSLEGLPFQDVPNHVARAVVSADLLFEGGRRFGEYFSFHPMISPYILHDLSLAWLVHVLGPYAAGRAWMAIALLSLPAAVAVFLRAYRCSGHAILLASVLSLYLGTDFTFVIGFTGYRLAVALTLLTLAAWHVFLESGSRRAFAAFAVGVGTGYLTHLSATFFTAIGVAVLTLLAVRHRHGAFIVPTAVLRRGVAGLVPLLAVVAWQVAMAGVAPEGGTEWSRPLVKVTGVFLPFHRYDRATEAVLLALFAATVALLLRRRDASSARRALVPATLAAVCFALYAVLPFSRSYVAYVDLRALPFAWLFVAIAAVRSAERTRPSWAATLVALALVAANLGVLARHLLHHDAVMREYRQVAAQMPAGVNFAPVATRARDGTTNPYLHAGNFATIEREARSPYLFSGGVTPYFRARYLITGPSEFWYQQDWEPGAGLRLAAYRYLLVLKPFDQARVPAELRVLAENRTAAILEVERPGHMKK